MHLFKFGIIYFGAFFGGGGGSHTCLFVTSVYNNNNYDYDYDYYE